MSPKLQILTLFRAAISLNTFTLRAPVRAWASRGPRPRVPGRGLLGERAGLETRLSRRQLSRVSLHVGGLRGTPPRPDALRGVVGAWARRTNYSSKVYETQTETRVRRTRTSLENTPCGPLEATPRLHPARSLGLRQDAARFAAPLGRGARISSFPHVRTCIFDPGFSDRTQLRYRQPRARAW